MFLVLNYIKLTGKSNETTPETEAAFKALSFKFHLFSKCRLLSAMKPVDAFSVFTASLSAENIADIQLRPKI